MSMRLFEAYFVGQLSNHRRRIKLASKEAHWRVAVFEQSFSKRGAKPMDADLSMLGQSEKISIDWYAYVVCLPSLMRLVCPATEVERTSSRAASSTPPRSESPVDSCRVALENAASIAGMLLTIFQCSKGFAPRLKCHWHFRLCDIKEPEPPMPAGNPGMGGMY